MDRYSEITNKNQREIVLLKAFPCVWGKCSFCDYILDNSNFEDEINKLKDKRKKMQREIYQQEDEIDMQRDKLQEEIRQKLNGTSEIRHIMTISFEVV